MKYIQCRVKKGGAKVTAWIPQNDAKLGQIVQLKEESGDWSHGWEISVVGFKTKNSKELIENHEGIFSKVKNFFK